jgi:hypothetical protein
MAPQLHLASFEQLKQNRAMRKAAAAAGMTISWIVIKWKLYVPPCAVPLELSYCLILDIIRLLGAVPAAE